MANPIKPIDIDAAQGDEKAAEEAKKEAKFVAKIRTGHRYEDFQPVTVSLKQCVLPFTCIHRRSTAKMGMMGIETAGRRGGAGQ